MSAQIEYKVVSSESLAAMVVIVNGLISDGWHPVGGISASTTYTPPAGNSQINEYAQAMIRLGDGKRKEGL